MESQAHRPVSRGGAGPIPEGARTAESASFKRTRRGSRGPGGPRSAIRIPELALTVGDVPGLSVLPMLPSC
jgi:hypothetical protein